MTKDEAAVFAVAPYLFAAGLSPWQSWGLIVVAVLAVLGLWFLLTETLDAINEWLNVRLTRRLDDEVRERELKAVVRGRKAAMKEAFPDDPQRRYELDAAARDYVRDLWK